MVSSAIAGVMKFMFVGVVALAMIASASPLVDENNSLKHEGVDIPAENALNFTKASSPEILDKCPEDKVWHRMRRTVSIGSIKTLPEHYDFSNLFVDSVTTKSFCASKQEYIKCAKLNDIKCVCEGNLDLIRKRMLEFKKMAIFLGSVFVIYVLIWCFYCCLLYKTPSPRDLSTSRMLSSAGKKKNKNQQ